MLRTEEVDQTLVDVIDSVLPQTQCKRCGYPDCRSYARAIVADAAPVNRCPPGGDAGARRLAQLARRAYLPLDPACGEERPRHVAVIDEAQCIGCTLCIRACPVDAIIGAAQLMHTVITELCSGCDLCVAPCPVDCITMAPARGADASWDGARADAARVRYMRRRARREQQVVRGAPARACDPLAAAAAPEIKRAAIAAAVERARARRRAP